MLAYLVSAALVVGASFVLGGAVLTLCGRRASDPLAGPAGLAALMVACGLIRELGGGQAFIAIVLIGVVLTAATAVVVGGSAPVGSRAAALPLAQGLATGALSFAVASIPYLAAGGVGILGVGLVNDDMASHLLLADWIREGFSPEPVLVGQGYPLGPHSLVAAIGWLLDAGTVEVFAGFNSALAVLLAITAFGLLRGLGRGARILGATLVAVPYLAAAYLAQEAFKEPIMALFVLAFAVAISRRPRRREYPAARYAIAALIAAGTLFVYSFPGLVWLGLTASIWLALSAVRVVRDSGEEGAFARLGAAARSQLVPLSLALGLLALVALLDLGRLLDFADFRALDPDRANEGGLGNLRGQISPLEAFGVWPSGEFRLSASESSLPAALFAAGGVLGLAAFAAALPAWVRRHGAAIPAALAAAALVYLAARGLGTVYTSAKALAVAAPLVALVAVGGLLGAGRAPGASEATPAEGRRGLPRPLAIGLAVLWALAAAGSSLLVLRQAPVGPGAHPSELAEIRPLVEGERVLFLGRDNFVLWGLRGSEPYTHVRNFYDPYFVEPNFDIEQVGSKFDFDSVDAKALAGFPFVLTTRASYASAPPPGYSRELVTDSYILWRAVGSPAGRVPAERGPEPGREIACGERSGDLGSSPVASVFDAVPVTAPASAWSPDAEPRGGAPSSIELDLPAGEWDLSLGYDATRPLTLRAEGFSQTIPANLDYRGVSPYWAAGTIDVAEAGPVRITADVASPPALGRLLGADSVAHLGPIAATPSGADAGGVAGPGPGTGQELVPRGAICLQGRATEPRYVDWAGPEPEPEIASDGAP